MGVYTAIALWITTPTIDFPGIGAIQFDWILIPLILISILFYRRRPFRSFTKADKYFILWISCWIFWIFSLVVMFQLEGELLKTLVISVSYRILMIVIPVALFSVSIDDLHVFAYAFLAVFVVEAIYAYINLTGNHALQYTMFIDTLTFASNYNINYHPFGRVASMATILIYTLLLNPKSRSIIYQVGLYLLAIFSCFIVIWSGTRQYIIATGLVLIPFVIWSLVKKVHGSLFSLLITVTIGITSYFFISIYSTELRLSIFSLEKHSAIRVGIYEIMWNWFSQSPIFGNGPYYGNVPTISHNIFLDALAAQGIIGFTFLVGFIVFIIYFSKGTLLGQTNRGQVWRMGALMIFLIGLIQAQFSANVLSASVLYLGGVMVWRLSTNKIDPTNEEIL